jgi:hypothetical protein
MNKCKSIGVSSAGKEIQKFKSPFAFEIRQGNAGEQGIKNF